MSSPTPFDHIWDKVISPVSQSVKGESDQEFAALCKLKLKSAEEWREGLYREYQRLRAQLKDICYGSSDHRSPEELLDGRKIAAVLCSSLISEKGYLFDAAAAYKLMEKKRLELWKQPVAFNEWAASNVYINYKLAYFASLQLVYLTLMRDLLVAAGLNEEDPKSVTPEMLESGKLARKLNALGHLAPYPPPPKGDGFDVNIIIGLARTDLSVQDLDMFLFAMQLYQIEEHTVDILKRLPETV